MSIEALLTELITTTASHTAALATNTAILECVVAGQEAAIARHDAGGGTTTRTTRARKAATDTPPAGEAEQEPATEEPAVEVHALLADANGATQKNAKGEDEPAAAYRAGAFTRDQVKNEFIGWLGETSDADVRKERAGFVGAIAQHFGVKLPFAPEGGLTDEEQFKQTLFYLRRKREGLKVDFAVDYDFDSDPLADQTLDGDAADDGLDALG